VKEAKSHHGLQCCCCCCWWWWWCPFLLSVFCSDRHNLSPTTPTILASQRPLSNLLCLKQPHRSEPAMQITGFQFR
jgi:hypothetical protein